MTPEQFELLLPLACRWAAEQEQRILSAGDLPSGAQLADARAVGVVYPERVRLLHVPEIPAPDDPILRRAAELTGLISPRTAGMALRYGIFVRADCAGDRALLVHELVHTAQYERLGGIEPFLRQYLLECLTVGYPGAPLEQEAIASTSRIGARD